MISKRNWNQFWSKGSRDPLDPLTWVNQRVRIRGWVEESNGSMIEMTYPEQLDFLEPVVKKQK